MINLTDDLRGSACVQCGEPRAEGNDLFCAAHQAVQDAYQRKNHISHLWHVWINKRQDERRARGLPWEGDLYEWKHACEEMERVPYWLKAAREGTLPTMHKQCSHSQPVPIHDNHVFCVLGQDVTRCPILVSLYKEFAEQRAHTFTRPDGAVVQTYSDMTPDAADSAAARTCAWHIFTEQQKGHAFDTSEGYVKHKGDQMFWDNVYDSLAHT